MQLEHSACNKFKNKQAYEKKFCIDFGFIYNAKFLKTGL